MFSDDCNLKDAIGIYQSLGLRFMPIHSVEEGCKHIKDTCFGQCFGKVPTTEHWPDKKFKYHDFKDSDNIALIMGKQHDGRWLVGFDIDGYLDLNRWFSLPITLECTTARGRHLIFEVFPDTALGNWNDILQTRSKTQGYKTGFQGALDIKYCRGAMVSPPSKTKNNQKYQWIRFMKPSWLPQEIVSFIKFKRKIAYPNVKMYFSWSQNPAHKGISP